MITSYAQSMLKVIYYSYEIKFNADTYLVTASIIKDIFYW